MIQTIEGRIGGGKTYTAMGWACNHLAKGGVLATNINVQVESFTDQYGFKRGLAWALKEYFGYILKPEQIIYLSDTKTVEYQTKKGVEQLNEITMFYKLVPRGTPDMPVMVVIDEAHIHFPQDGYRSIPHEVLHFLTLSRHACVDVVFISQHIKNMWCQMLRLAQFRWAVRDMRKYGFPIGVFNLPWLIPQYLQNKNDYDGVTTLERHMPLEKSWLYETYRSPEMASAFESMPAASRVEIETRGLTMKERWLLLAAGFACGLAVMVIPACKSREAVQSVEVAAPVSPASVVEVTVSEPVSEPDPEYFIAYVSGGESGSLVTTKRTYLLGDPYSDSFIVRIVDHGFFTQDGASYRFDSKPRSDEPERQVP